ncbi:MAG: autotransporter-associated beta strand repeat-containing protein [Candidatus Didemnitutus sp.]|nr:autotransporter-associated beta strand repeat-containing protein [Candidatus Didemnitutus sp.]
MKIPYFTVSRGLAAVSALFLLPSFVLAQSLTWEGGPSGTNQQIRLGTNWLDGGANNTAPSDTTDLTIGTTTNTTIPTLLINASMATRSFIFDNSAGKYSGTGLRIATTSSTTTSVTAVVTFNTATTIMTATNNANVSFRPVSFTNTTVNSTAIPLPTMSLNLNYTGKGAINVDATSLIQVSEITNNLTGARFIGTGGINKTGAGSLRLHVEHTFTGGFELSQGTVITNGSSAQSGGTITSGPMGTGTLILSGGSLLGSTTTGSRTYHNPITLNGTVAINTNATTAVATISTAGGGSTTLARNSTIDVGSGASDGGVLWNQIISGAFSLTKNGTNPLTLNGANNFTGGTIINAGTLTGDVAGGDLQVVTDATYSLGNADRAVAALSGAGNVSLGSQTLTVGSAANSTFSGAIAGSGALNKVGGGVLTLSGTNTYTGATTVSAGMLIINGSTASGSAVTVASGGTLSGSGTVGGATTVQSGGILAPGNSPGLMTFSDGLTLDNGSITNFEINGTTRGTTYDAINLTSGLMTYGGTFNLSFGDAIANGSVLSLFALSGSGSAGAFSSIAATGSYTGSFTNDSGVWSLTSGAQVLSFSQSTGNLSFAAIPEPSTYAVIFGALALVGVMVRRRRRAAS